MGVAGFISTPETCSELALEAVSDWYDTLPYIVREGENFGRWLGDEGNRI
jgi:hypothetical protein